MSEHLKSDPMSVVRSLRRTLARSSAQFAFDETAVVGVSEPIIGVYSNTTVPQRVVVSAGAFWLVEPDRVVRIAFDAIERWEVPLPVGAHAWFDLETKDDVSHRVWLTGKTADGGSDIHVFLRFLLLVLDEAKRQARRRSTGGS